MTPTSNLVRRAALLLHTSPVATRAADLWFLLFIFYVLVVPAGRNNILLPAIAVTAGIGITRMVVAAANGATPAKIRRLLLLPAAAGLVPVALGIVFDTPGWSDVAVPLVAAPVVWFFLSYAGDEWVVDRLLSVVALAAIVLFVIIVMLVTGVGRSLVQVLQPSAFGLVDGGAARVSVTGASSLIGIVPLLGSAIFDSSRRRVRLTNHYLIWNGFLFGLFGALLSGRQGVVGAVGLTPVLLAAVSLVGFRLKKSAELTGRSFVVSLGVVVILGSLVLGAAAAVGVSPSRLPTDLMAAVGVGDDAENDRVRSGSEVRNRQADSFIDGWKERPITGHGAGAVSPEFYTWRRYEVGDVFTITPRPWRAEMHYHLLLFESGILGLCAYGLAVLVILRELRTRFRTFDDRERVLIRAGLVSAAALSLVTAYNPLVRAMGQQLPLYFPIILVALLATPSASRVSAARSLVRGQASTERSSTTDGDQ